MLMMTRKSRGNFNGRTSIYERFSHLTESKFEDPLMFLLTVPELIQKYNFIFVLTVVTFILCMAELLLYMTELIVTFDPTLVLKYGSHVGVVIFMIICLYNALVFGRTVTDLGHEFRKKLIPMEFTEEKTLKQIHYQIKILKSIVYLGLFTGGIAAGLYAIDNQFNENEVYLFTITKNMTWMHLGQILHIFYRSSYFYLALVAIANAYTVSYIGLHSKYQLMILAVFVKHICDNNCQNEEDLYYDAMSQMVIKERMKICIMIYQSIYSGIKNFIEKVYMASARVLLGSLFLGGGIMIELFRGSDANGSFESHFFISVAGALNMILYILVGQGIKDESINVREKLLKLPWYNMNKTNKQILWIFLMRTDSPVSFDTDLMIVDYLLLVRIIRGLYSVFTILSQTMKRKTT